MQATFVDQPLIPEIPTFTTEQELPNAFTTLFRNLPIVGPLIEERQGTGRRERVKFAIKRLIVTACALSPVLSSIDVSSTVYAVLLVTNVANESSIAVFTNEANYIDRYIDAMDDKQFDLFYAVLACGILGPWLFDRTALAQVLEKAWATFASIMESIQKKIEKASKVAWNFAGKPTVKTIQKTKDELALISKIIGTTVDAGCIGAAWLLIKLDDLTESFA
ncbi:MAG: hypothetical protein AAGC93_19955 [Cyanobacteria bacterium P01_F01_bin.53]